MIGGTWKKQVGKVVADSHDNYNHNLTNRKLPSGRLCWSCESSKHVCIGHICIPRPNVHMGLSRLNIPWYWFTNWIFGQDLGPFWNCDPDLVLDECARGSTINLPGRYVNYALYSFRVIVSTFVHSEQSQACLRWVVPPPFSSCHGVVHDRVSGESLIVENIGNSWADLRSI